MARENVHSSLFSCLTTVFSLRFINAVNLINPINILLYYFQAAIFLVNLLTRQLVNSLTRQLNPYLSSKKLDYDHIQSERLVYFYFPLP